MPTYDYECKKCGHTFEYFKTISAPDPKGCPECKGRIKRLIGTGAGIIFKGSGFHETDYRKSEYKKKAEKEAQALKNDSGGNGNDPCSTCPAASKACSKD